MFEEVRARRLDPCDWSERRRHERQAVDLWVRQLRPVSRGLRVTSWGPGGFYCPLSATETRLGELAVFEIEWRRGEESVLIPAWVVRFGAGSKAERGMGLEFLSPQSHFAEMFGDG